MRNYDAVDRGLKRWEELLVTGQSSLPPTVTDKFRSLGDWGVLASSQVRLEMGMSLEISSETQCVRQRAAGAHWSETLGHEPGAGLPPFLESRASLTHADSLILGVSGSAGFFSKVGVPQILTRLSYPHGVPGDMQDSS